MAYKIVVSGLFWAVSTASLPTAAHEYNNRHTLSRPLQVATDKQPTLQPQQQLQQQFQEKSDQLLRWLSASGANVSAIVCRLDETTGERGVFSSRPIGAGEQALHVPREAILCTRDAFAAFQQSIARALPSDRRASQLAALYDLWERSPELLLAAAIADRRRFPRPWIIIPRGGDHDEGGEGRDFSAFYQVLASTVRLRVLPIYWSPEERARLRGLELYERVEGRIATLEYFRRRISSERLWSSGNAAAVFDAAYGNVLSHGFGAFHFNGTFEDTCIVPLGGMVNERNLTTSSAVWYLGALEPRSFTFMTTRSLRAGEEIFTSYGDNKDPQSFLFSYGFVPEEQIPRGFHRNRSLQFADVLHEIERRKRRRDDVP